MKKIKALPNQTIYDIAVAEYGTCEAIAEILSNNPTLENDPVYTSPVDQETGFTIDWPVMPGSSVLIDENSRWRMKNIIRDIDKEVTTYD